jgi:hypothetical protein
MVAGAVVSARNTETGAQYDSVTTATGNYTLSSLPAGVYEVIVSARGSASPSSRDCASRWR